MKRFSPFCSPISISSLVLPSYISTYFYSSASFGFLSPVLGFGTLFIIYEIPIYIDLGVFEIPLVCVTKSIVPFIGWQTKPSLPKPNPSALPSIPLYFIPFTGSFKASATALNILDNVFLVPYAIPRTTSFDTFYLFFF